jgi:two-component system nitrogen regulation response regulator GlnG
MSTLLVVDDDRAVLHLVAEAFADSEVKVLTAGSAADCLAAVRQHHPDVVLLDIMLPNTSGLDVFRQVHEIDPRLPVIFITAGGTSDTAIEAMKLGAHDYLLKPLDLGRVHQLVHQALEMRRLMHVHVSIPEADADAFVKAGDMLIGRSPEMQEVYKAIGRVAPQDVTVLIRGESGTGKELVARAIYHHSKRAGKPFLAVNCAAITESLLESELFGYEKGAFTGADQRRIGKFEQCNGGTIFLDEVGDMSPLVQSKVLRVLQEQRFERVGGNETIRTDVRIITATNRDLEAMVNDGKFRSDLYYRLNGFTIDLPPLRKRPSDLVVLIDYFLARFSRELGKELHSLSPEAMAMLTRYHWPGNVRELQSVLKQSLLQATGPVIIPEFLPETVRTLQGTSPRAESDGLPVDELRRFIDQRLEAGSTNLYAEALELMEKYLLTRVLRLTDGNQSKAAAVLGITRGSLRNKIRSLGIAIDQIVRIENRPPSHAALQ